MSQGELCWNHRSPSTSWAQGAGEGRACRTSLSLRGYQVFFSIPRPQRYYSSPMRRLCSHSL